jgi:Lamin Tail Domain
MEKHLFFHSRKIVSLCLWCEYFFILLFFLPSILFAQVKIVAIFPNTIDDKNLEYIEVRNTGCETIDISNYTFEDALPKVYTIPSGTLIGEHMNYQFIRPVTKIELNNTNEIVRLRDMTANIISEYSYATSTKGEVILISEIQDQDCTLPDTQTGTTSDTWVIVDMGSSIPELPDTQTGILDEGISTWEIQTESLSGEILTDFSWSIDTATGDVFFDTGATSTPVSSSSGMPLMLTGEILPVSLSYDDLDLDGAVDTLFIEYDVLLTGALLPENISLYSNTGWLYMSGVLTQTGYILGGTLSGNILILSIRESDYQKSILSISNTTRSDLRLKNTLYLWIHGLDGRPIANFLLTTSFDNYRNVYSMIAPVVLLSNDSWVILHPSGTGGVFPEVLLTIQNYTNARYESWAFFCTEIVCRINLNFEPIFTRSMKSTNYNCHIVFGTGEYQSCNPPQFTFSQSWSIQFILTEKATNIEQLYQYEVFYTPMIQWTTSQSFIAWMIDTTPPVIIVEMDGKWKDSFEQIGDTELNCYSFTCGINLTAERSYDSEWGKIRFIWLYDGTNSSESKDPWVRYFTIGDHDIWLRVIDASGNASHIHYKLHVYPPKEKTSIEEKKAKKGKTKTASSVDALKKKKKKKKPKKLKMDFFDAPEWKIQSSGSLIRDGNSIFCTTKTKYCSINLTLTNPESWILYTWIYPDGTEITSKNPRSFRFDLGKWSVRLIASNQEWQILSQESFFIHVKKSIAPKKKRKKSVKKIKKKISIPQKQIKNPSYSEDTSAWILSLWGVSLMKFFLVLIPLLGGYMILIFRRKIFARFFRVE